MFRPLPSLRATYGVASSGTSQNGWPASDSPSAIGIVTLSLNLRNGTKTVQVSSRVADVFREIIAWWDENIEPVETLGGYNYREIRGYEGSGTLSNHSSGTAIDINAAKHPLGAVGTFTTAQAAMITAKAATLGLRWGGDYRGRKDEHHLEVVFSPTAEIARQAAMNYWWVGLISAAAVAGAFIYRRRFR
jgi:hypothetical protein